MTHPARDQLDRGPTYGVGEDHTSYGRGVFPGIASGHGSDRADPVPSGPRSAPNQGEAEVEREDG